MPCDWPLSEPHSAWARGEQITQRKHMFTVSMKPRRRLWQPFNPFPCNTHTHIHTEQPTQSSLPCIIHDKIHSYTKTLGTWKQYTGSIYNIAYISMYTLCINRKVNMKKLFICPYSSFILSIAIRTFCYWGLTNSIKFYSYSAFNNGHCFKAGLNSRSKFLHYEIYS